MNTLPCHLAAKLESGNFSEKFDINSTFNQVRFLNRLQNLNSDISELAVPMKA
jgi:hypothetical protein